MSHFSGLVVLTEKLTLVLFAYDLNKAVFFCTNILYKRTSQKHCYILAINLHMLDFQARMELRVY